MTYWLEKRTVQRRGNPHKIIWKRYAACGRCELLERVRIGQRHPEHWRVILAGFDKQDGTYKLAG